MGMDARGRAVRVDRRLWSACVLFAWDRRGEQLARMGDVVGADAACEQSVMADAVKTCWQDLDEEATPAPSQASRRLLEMATRWV